jgi:hypothetical protein
MFVQHKPSLFVVSVSNRHLVYMTMRCRSLANIEAQFDAHGHPANMLEVVKQEGHIKT